MIQNIPFNMLVPTPLNVRKVKTGIDSLAASIASRDGLMQNLVVVSREDGKFEVIAGERRRRAIAKLIKDKIWHKDVEIPCKIAERDEATSMSYSENRERVAMHPADAIRAMGQLHSEGQSVRWSRLLGQVGG
jgi:ParB family chromosome partitioning protein